MPKGIPNKRYTPEFKKKVIETMQEEKLGYRETAQRFEIRRVVSRVMRKFDLALAEIYFRGRVHAPWLPSSGQGAKGQGRRYAARLALDAL